MSDGFINDDFEMGAVVSGTFKELVEAKTGITISTDPTETEASIYLREGVTEVTNRMLVLDPESAHQFSKAHVVYSNSSLKKFLIGDIISVLRESGTEGDYRACRYVAPELTSRVTDKNSIHYSSQYNPSYSLDKEYVEIFPEPHQNEAGNLGKVYNVNKLPRNHADQTLVIGHHKLGWFPQTKVYLVIIYASIRILDKLVNAAQSMPSDLSDINIRIPVLPDVPTLTTNSISFSQTAPSYTLPTLALEEVPSISDLEITATPPAVPSISDNSLSFSATAPTYNKSAVAPDFADADNWITTEEDSEMVASRVQVISTQLQEYQANIQNNLNNFNKENIEYQAELQRAIQNAQLAAGDDSQKLQKYQAEVGTYQAETNKQVQKYTQNFQKDLQLWQINRSTSIQKYQADLSNNLNKFNEENVVYQLEFQKAVQDAQLSQADDGQAIQKYQSQLTAYSAEVNREIQEINKLTAETQKYSAQVQKVKMDIDLYHQRSVKLQEQYDAAFQLMGQNVQGQQQQQRRRK